MNTIRSILAAIDLGPDTPAVLRTAEALAQDAGAELHVVHAIELDWKGSATTAQSFQTHTKRAQSSVAAALAQSLRTVTPASVEVVLYSRHRTVADRARAVKADLIVIGSHGHGRARLGTTLDRVLRTVDCPVWIVRRKLKLPLQRIVVATDMSHAGAAALDSAADVVRQFGSADAPTQIVLLHVLQPSVWKSLAQPCRRELEARVAEWLAQQELADRVRVRIALTRANATAEGILAWLRRSPPGLLIMGTHGHGMIDRLLLGSVAARVLRNAPCSALAVPPALSRTGRKR